MNANVNQPCNSSLATSFIIRINESNWRRKRRKLTSPFADEVVEEGLMKEWQKGVSLHTPIVLSFDAAEIEGVECVRRALEQLGGEVIFGTGSVFDADNESEDTFVDVVGSGQRWGRRVWGFYIRGCSHACESALRNCFEGCCHFIQLAIVLVFILHFCEFLLLEKI